MAFTNEQILGAIENQRAAGFSDADIRTGAERLGIDLGTVNTFLGGGAAAPAPAAAPSVSAPPAPAPAPVADFSPPAPAPAPTFSNQQVYDAYQTSLGQGISDADIRNTGLARFGIQETQLNDALKQFGQQPSGLIQSALPPAPAPAPAAAAPAPASAAPGGTDSLYGRFGASQYDPNKSNVGSLIDPRTGGADFSNRNLFDANGNRIASNSGVPFGEIKNVISNILADTSLTSRQQADVISGYIGSRGIGNADVANALGISQQQADAYLGKALYGNPTNTVTSDFYRNQRANAALVPLPDNPIPAYSKPVESTADNGAKSYRVSDLFSIDLHPDGKRINGVSIYDPATGQKLTTAPFYADGLLAAVDRLGLGGNLGIFAGLNEAVKQIGLPFLPYEQYGPQGSDHGIDFDLLAKGFQGTAYDQTQDANTLLKGPSALGQLQSTQALFDRYGIEGQTGLIGKNIPGFITQAVGGNGPGGVRVFDPSIFGVTRQDFAPGGYQFGDVRGAPLYNPIQGYQAPAATGFSTEELARQGVVAAPGIINSVAAPAVSRAPTIVGGGPSQGISFVQNAAPLVSQAPNAGGISTTAPNTGGSGGTITSSAPNTGAVLSTDALGNTFSSPTQTVEGIVTRLLGEESPFLRRARELALQQANERGLLNSSIAAGAGTAAAIDAALQIANPDAAFANELQRLATANGYDLNRLNVLQRQQLETLAVQNLYNQQNQVLAADLDLQRLAVANGYDLQRLTLQQAQNLETLAVQQGFNRENVATQLRNQMSLNNQQNQLQTGQNQQQLQNQMALNAQQFGFQSELQRLQTTMGTQSNSYNLATNIINQASQTINNILQDPNIPNEGTPSPKQQLIDKIKETTRNQLSALSATAGVDLSAVFR